MQAITVGCAVRTTIEQAISTIRYVDGAQGAPYYVYVGHLLL
ncbi:hypothetical protein [Undibacterium danionis]|jgi:hypothetical protein|uniref:Uncharacterized protein n=1 Tax=Undibacterium danionis TaxID=1812100 RepID=A0ABV6ICA1_9BURK